MMRTVGKFPLKPSGWYNKYWDETHYKFKEPSVQSACIRTGMRLITSLVN